MSRYELKLFSIKDDIGKGHHVTLSSKGRVMCTKFQKSSSAFKYFSLPRVFEDTYLTTQVFVETQGGIKTHGESQGKVDNRERYQNAQEVKSIRAREFPLRPPNT